MKPFPVIVLMSLVYSLSFAQEPPRIIPPAPEAASVFKFSEVPVSLYTGVPNISIPIHEIKCKQLTIPIHLSYHARGNRVDEIASRVGLGWSLNYGGMMSRQIRDGADEEAQGYLRQDYYNDVFTDENVFNSLYHNVIFNNPDLIPDKFMFDANGTSGNFIFNSVTKDILLQQYKDIKIEKIHDSEINGAKIHGWILTDDAGNKFYYGISKNGLRTAFDVDELMESNTLSSITRNVTFHGTSSDTRSISSWHLMEIETPFNETVSFYYVQEEPIYYRHSHDIHNFSEGVTVHFSKIRANQWQLSRIEYDQGEIDFVPADSVRKDLPGAYALDKIIIWSNTSSSGSMGVKEYKFNYHYTTSTNNTNQVHYLRDADSTAMKRMFLSSIQESGQQFEDIPPYTFHYNPIPLPNRFSTSQDAWGYYNGAPNGEYLTFFKYDVDIDRGVDEVMASAGMLEKIDYPTGGSVEFTYEQNIGAVPGFMNQVLFPSLHKEENVLKGVSFLKPPGNPYPPGVFTQSNIVIGERIDGNVAFEINLANCPTGQPLEEECVYSVHLKNSSADYFLYPSGTAGARTGSFAIEPGTYTLEVTQNNPGITGSQFYVTLDWIQDTTIVIGGVTEGFIPGAGKRVKKIKYKDSDQTIIQEKEYNYLKPDGQSSGVILGLPGFYHLQDHVLFTAVDRAGCGPGSPFSTYQGNSVGYSFVTEYMGTADNNVGMTEHEFTTVQDGGADYYKFPYNPPTDYEWLRGKSMFTRIYKKNDSGTFSTLKVIENRYLHEGNLFDSLGLAVPEFLHIDSLYITASDRTNFRMPLIVIYSEDGLPASRVYYQKGGTFDPLFTRETYYENNEIKLETEVKYSYSYNKHYQVKSSETLRSDNTKEISVTTYADDYTTGTPFIDALKTANMKSYPIEKVTYQEREGNYTILSGVLSEYSNSSPGLLSQVSVIESSKPVSLAAFRFSNRPLGELPLTGTAAIYSPYSGYVPKIRYELYDSKGNVLQYSTGDNIKVTYLWSYDQRYPVAEIRNASYNQVASVLGSTVINGLAGYPASDAALRLSLQPLYTHASLQQAQTSVYTYNTAFGVTSVTDPNGVITYYTYDNFGRLKTVKDQDENLLKLNRYQYRSQED